MYGNQGVCAHLEHNASLYNLAAKGVVAIEEMCLEGDSCIR